jgi:hypothetical protein
MECGKINPHQGDVKLMRVDAIPAGAKFVRKDAVAYGEVTGHTHCLPGCEIYERDGALYMSTPVDGTMVHDDHPAIVVPSGKYRIEIQQEYFPDGTRNVSD